MPETPPQGQPDEAMVDLLIKQVTEGLSSAEQRELDVMDSEMASAYLRDFERAAAAVTLAAGTGRESLPPELAQRIARQADEHFATLAGTAAPAQASVSSLEAARSAKLDAGAAAAAAAAESTRGTPPGGSRSGAYGWLAAAACLVLAVFGWMRSPAPPEAPAVAVIPPTTIIPPVPPPPAPPPTPAAERSAMLAKSDSIKVTLGATKDPSSKGVSADVVWDPVTQKGFLHLVGLASNDPAVKQYQLWIFDAARDQRYPIDGGVFDVPADASEVVIPFNASLQVNKAAAFAVTVEKPGGVVVSARQHVVALGAAS
jgi:anti-sigma-K factor RskA